MSEMEAAIKRLMKYCGAANKQVNQSAELWKLILDIELLYSGSMKLIEQRDAALKLAADFAGYSDDASIHGLTGAASAFWQCANELRAIFAPKEGK